MNKFYALVGIVGVVVLPICAVYGTLTNLDNSQDWDMLNNPVVNVVSVIGLVIILAILAYTMFWFRRDELRRDERMRRAEQAFREQQRRRNGG